MGKKVSRPRPPMDGQTSIAFAREAFEQLHPVVPPWFWRSIDKYTQEELAPYVDPERDPRVICD